jgi:hypothetical protein
MEVQMSRFFGLLIINIASFGLALGQFEPKTTVGGYGELHYNEPDGSARGVLDFHRFVIYIGHDFTEQLSLRSETEIEHTKIEAGEEEGGEVAIEQAFLEYRILTTFGIRAGILLPPVGITNQYHEPPTFNGVERPMVEQIIIPSTWRESGAGVFGTLADNLGYQLYLVAGLKAEGFTAANGIRGGRQEAMESNPANPSLTGRLDYSPILDLMLGGSFFIGNSAADHDSIDNAPVTVLSADARYSIGALQFKGVLASVSIGDAELINRAFNNGVADKVLGWYIEGAYDVLPLLARESEQILSAFIRYEKVNTQASVTGFTALRQFDRMYTIVGLTYKPVHNAAFKVDYAFLANGENSGAFRNSGQLNIGMGFHF